MLSIPINLNLPRIPRLVTSPDLAYPHHHPRFDFDETALAMGVEIFVRCVENYSLST